MDDDDEFWYVDTDWQEQPEYDEDGEDEGMYIKLHGGACCGVKHIHELGSDPTLVLSAREALTGEATSHGRVYSTGVNDAHADLYPQDFFCYDAPQETRLARLDRLLSFLKVERPHGIVEIVLTLAQEKWFKLLEERGFKEVTRGTNSNTGRTLVIFHLSY